MKAAKFLLNPLGGIVGALTKKKKAPTTATGVPPTALTREELLDQMRSGALLRRRGGAADIVTGSFGAEAPPGGKLTLGS